MRLGIVAGLVALSLGTAAEAAPAAWVEPGAESGAIQQVASVFSDTVRFVQEQLAVQGYYPGAIDGIAGPKTRAAVRAYEADHGLPVTGNAYALADQLNFGNRIATTTTQRRVVIVERPVIVPAPPVVRRAPYYGPTIGLYVGPRIGWGYRGWGGRHGAWRR